MKYLQDFQFLEHVFAIKLGPPDLDVLCVWSGSGQRLIEIFFDVLINFEIKKLINEYIIFYYVG